MPLSVTELISLLRRGREAMLQVALDEQRGAPAVVVARALLSVAPATLHACLLDGEPPQLAVVDSAGQPLPALPKASSRSVDTGLAQILGAEKVAVVTRPIKSAARQLGELGLGWKHKPDGQTHQALEYFLEACGHWLGARLAGQGNFTANSKGEADLFGLASVNELVGPMIHEFNNFLNTTALQMAVLETEVPEKALPDLSVIRNQSNAVARVIKHFQRYRDEQRPPAAPVDLNRVAQAAAEYWQRGAGARRAEHAAPTTVRLELAGHAPCVIAGVNSETFCLVHFLLSQVAASLPATEQGVRLRTVSAGERVELHVEGLSAGPKEEATAEHDEPLELAACRSLVRRMYGKMRTRWSAGGLAVTADFPAAGDKTITPP